jgi:biopolymer transport protein ExbB/TolQ
MNPQTRRTAALWLVTVFVLGAATGGVFGYSFAHHSYAATRSVLPSDAERRAKKIAEMKEEIGLTPDQIQKADAIIASAQAEMKAIHEKDDAEVAAVRAKWRDELRQYLTAEQKPKFEAYVSRLDEERKKQKDLQNGK